MERLAKSRVAIFGLGGVGGYVLEALARSGVGNFDLFDSDKITLSNLNRQILATFETLGKFKTDAAKNRALSINPDASINCNNIFFLPQNAKAFDFSKYDYVVDAVDTVSAKIQIILQAKAAGAKVISCMGTANKTRPDLLEAADIFQSRICPLAKIMRHELKKRGVKNVKAVFSTEVPRVNIEENREKNESRIKNDGEEKSHETGGRTKRAGFLNAAAEENAGDFSNAADSKSQAASHDAAAKAGGVLADEGKVADGVLADEGKVAGGGRAALPSAIFVPAVAGLLVASEVVRDLMEEY